MPDAADTARTRSNQRLSAAAKWLAGVLIVLALAAGATYSYRHQAELRRGRAEWDAEVARIREFGDPLTAYSAC
jgi:hypothetical protein